MGNPEHFLGKVAFIIIMTYSIHHLNCITLQPNQRLLLIRNPFVGGVTVRVAEQRWNLSSQKFKISAIFLQFSAIETREFRRFPRESCFHFHHTVINLSCNILQSDRRLLSTHNLFLGGPYDSGCRATVELQKLSKLQKNAEFCNRDGGLKFWFSKAISKISSGKLRLFSLYCY